MENKWGQNWIITYINLRAFALKIQS